MIANFFLEYNKQGKGGNSFSKKIEIDFKTTALDVINKMLQKLILMNNKFAFDPQTKILKVRSQNDYVFDLNQPLINYTYVIECLKMNKSPDYLIIDNPLLNQKEGGGTPNMVSNSPPITESYKNSVIPGGIVKSTSGFEKKGMRDTVGEGNIAKNDLENIAIYDPYQHKINNDVPKPSFVLNKYANKKNTERGSLNDLIDSIDKEIENNLKRQYEENAYQPDEENEKELNELLNNNQNKDINYSHHLYNNNYKYKKSTILLLIF